MPASFSLWDVSICVSCFLLCLLFRIWRNRTPRPPLPPGPHKLPLIRNLLDFPSDFEWETFQTRSKEYKSDILHLNVAGTSLVVLNSIKVASDLMDKRSSIYSSRPKFTLINKYMGFAWLLPFLPYGPAWKERRRIFQRYFQSKAFNVIWEQQETHHMHRLLLQLLETPENYMEHIRHFVGGTLYSVEYGTSTNLSNDPYINLAEDVMSALSDTAIPISGLIDVIPWSLPLVARIFPGRPFNKTQAEWKDLVYRFRDEPFIKIQKLIAVNGNLADAFVPRSLEDIDSSKSDKIQHDLIKDIASIVFIGGSSTTKAVLLTFFLAMMCFPEAQIKAQEELDRVVGRERLPELRDEPALPYLSALIKEVQRWNAPGPIGIPHFLERDDEYNGYLIPRQSIILANTWAMLNDEKEYPDPRSFKPERFLKDGRLNPSIRDPADANFGFGRRICPGAHIATSIISISAASVLSTFTISKKLDENGKVVEPNMKYHSGVTYQPEPFECTLKPRHDKAEHLIGSYISSTLE